MTHLDPDRLADRALGIDDPLTAAEQNHLAGCPECRDQLAELSRIAELSHHPEELAQVPADAIWRSVQGQLASPAPAPAITEVAAKPPPSPPNVSEPPPSSPTVTELPRRTPRPRPWLLVAAAAVVGLIVGIGVTTVAVREGVDVTSSTALQALPGQTGQGTAELVSDRGASRAQGADRRPAHPGSLPRGVADQHRRPTHVHLGCAARRWQSQLPSPTRTRRTAPRLHHRRRIDRTVRRQSGPLPTEPDPRNPSHLGKQR